MQSSSPTRRAGDRVSAIKTVSGVISTFTLCVRACERTSHAGGVYRVVSATKSWRLLLLLLFFFLVNYYSSYSGVSSATRSTKWESL